jgi:hypothetical protein
MPPKNTPLLPKLSDLLPDDFQLVLEFISSFLKVKKGDFDDFISCGSAYLSSPASDLLGGEILSPHVLGENRLLDTI